MKHGTPWPYRNCGCRCDAWAYTQHVGEYLLLAVEARRAA